MSLLILGPEKKERVEPDEEIPLSDKLLFFLQRASGELLADRPFKPHLAGIAQKFPSLLHYRRKHMAAAPDDLCTLADLKSWLPNQGNNDDVTLQNLISNGSLQVLQFIDRPHILASVLGSLTETYDGNGSDRLLPRQFPIITVTSVSIDGIPISQAASPTSAGFLWDPRRILLRGFRFCRGIQNVQFAYTAGYAAVPLDLRQAAIEAFALAYRQRVRIGERSNGMSGQITISFDMSDVPPRSLSIFNQYRRLAL